MDRRRHTRVAAELPVRVWGVNSFSQPFAQPARTKNISTSGMVIVGLTSSVRLGSVLEVQLDQEKAQYCVIWIGKPGTRKHGEVGLAKLASEPCLFVINTASHSAALGHG
jgi:hypothetical protein